MSETIQSIADELSRAQRTLLLEPNEENAQAALEVHLRYSQAVESAPAAITATPPDPRVASSEQLTQEGLFNLVSRTRQDIEHDEYEDLPASVVGPQGDSSAQEN